MDDFERSPDSGDDNLVAALNSYVIEGQQIPRETMLEFVHLPYHKQREIFTHMGEKGLRLAMASKEDQLRRYGLLCEFVNMQKPSSYEEHGINGTTGEGIYAVDKTKSTAGRSRLYHN